MENKPTERIHATHFIEQFSNRNGNTIKEKRIVSTAPADVSEMPHYLNETTKYLTIHTVAIFKIKYK